MPISAIIVFATVDKEHDMTTLPTTIPHTLTWPTIIILVWGRWLISVAFRLVYPLLTLLAANFTVDLNVASLLITVQVAASLLSPLGGFVSDRIGDRATMLWGSIIFCIGSLICALSRSFGWFLLGYAVIGLAVAIAMPALQSYVSTRSRYEQRGRMLGVLELSWALSALLGIPLVTWISERFGIATAFGVLTVAAIATVLLFLVLPNDRHATEPSTSPPSFQSTLQTLRQSNVLAALGFVFIQLAAVELIFVSYAGWLSSAFAATTTQLGLVFGLLGVVELLGSLTATLFTDRIGKRRAVLGGFTLVGIWLLLLPQSNSWPVFLSLLLAFDLCFEFAIVSTFPLISGLNAQNRGAILAVMTACIGGGRIVGSLVGPWLNTIAGYTINSTLAGICVLIGVGMGWWFMHEGRA